MPDYLNVPTDYFGYLPELYKEIREFQEIANTVNAEFDLLKQTIKSVLNEQFTQTAVQTLKDRENEYHIEANSNESLEFRRSRLIERKSRKPPITVTSLRERLNSLIGTTEALVELIPNEYAFVIRIPAVDAFKFKDIQQIVEHLKPAIMEYIQKPFTLESVRIVETSTEIKIVYARAGFAIAGKTRIGTVINLRVVYQR